jgi:hypothetical protein
VKTESEMEVRLGEIIATFGEAALVRQDGEIELRGGSMADRVEALEWMSLMMPGEAVRVRKA